jgi:DNA polymerase-3 subunit delta'
MWQIIGHDSAVRLLQQSLMADHLAQAYLFVGPPQIGKTTVALQLAQAVNCQSEKRPCGECLSCQKIARHVHPDVRIIEADQGVLKIAQIRELQREASLSPYEGRWRVFVIPNFQLATAEAANALLKTLEEPPRQVILVLTATDVGALLPTIISRCQVVFLQPLPVAQVAEALRRQKVSHEEADLLARISEGRIGWALQAVSDKQILEDRRNRLTALRNLTQETHVQRLEYAQQICQKPENLPDILHLWMSWWRDVLLVKAGCADMAINVDQLAALQRDAQSFQWPQIGDFVRAVQRIKTELTKNANPRLALEVLVIKCPHLPSQKMGA